MNQEAYSVPNTHMSAEDEDAFVRILRAMPSNTGFMVSHCIEPPHTPAMFNGYSAIVMLPGSNARGDASGNTPAKALMKAWALAHLDAAEKLMPKEQPLQWFAVLRKPWVAAWGFRLSRTRRLMCLVETTFHVKHDYTNLK